MNMKKRALALVFAAFMALSVSGCSNNDAPKQSDNGGGQKQEEVQPPDLTGDR